MKKNEAGQAMTEMILMIPLMAMLMGGAVSVVYLCWQGVKVQQAANLAARINGQERVSGGTSVSKIEGITGMPSIGLSPDLGATVSDFQHMREDETAAWIERNKDAKPDPTTVFGRIVRRVSAFFGGPEDKLKVEQPFPGLVTDTVHVVKVVEAKSFMGLKVGGFLLKARAYGGEDPRMYALPRWGDTDGASAGDPLEYEKLLLENKGEGRPQAPSQ